MPVNVESLHQREQSVLFYEERFAKGYVEEWPIEKKQRLIDLLRELPLPERGRGLDFGCGNGVLTSVLAEALPKWTIEGADVSEIAIRHATIRYPQCCFFLFHEDRMPVGSYDLVFTHHVLEHVYDLDLTWNALVRLLGSKGNMVHILPCGNEGSFEFRLCSLRKGGIDAAKGNRFFFEDEGHLRRLCTEDLQRRAMDQGFLLQKEYYSNQWFGAVDWITQSPLSFVRDISDPKLALAQSSQRWIFALRGVLLVFWWARFLVAEHGRIRAKHPKGIKHYAFLIGSAPVYLVAWGADMFLKWKAKREWITQRSRRAGSEMYLYFARG